MSVIKRIKYVDYKIFQLIERKRWTAVKSGSATGMERTMIAVARFSPATMLAIIAGIGVYGLLEHLRTLFHAVPACVAAGFLSRFASGCLSRLVLRERPFKQLSLEPLIVHQPDASFPSNHAAGGFALATALVYANQTVGICYFLWAVVLAYSRMYVRLHFFSDVLFGAFLGVVSGVLCGMLI